MDLYLLACASEADGGGIYRYALDGVGKLHRADVFCCDQPMYSIIREGVMHTVLHREKGKQTGAYISQCISVDGSLDMPAAVKPSLGEVPCHLAVQGDDVYLVNYVTGNVVKNGELAVAHEGCGPHITRQEKAHTHFIAPLPDGHLGVCDLGNDTLYVYDGDLVEVSRARVPAGYGIRHFVWKKVGDGYQIYAINELLPSVSRFAYAEGKATYLDTVAIPRVEPRCTAATIRLSPDGTKLYTSVRGENILSVFDVSADGKPKLLQSVCCGGDGPRDFDLTDTHLICTNQFSNSVTVFEIEKGLIGKMTHQITLPEPLCVVIKEKW